MNSRLDEARLRTYTGTVKFLPSETVLWVLLCITQGVFVGLGIAVFLDVAAWTFSEGVYYTTFYRLVIRPLLLVLVWFCLKLFSKGLRFYTEVLQGRIYYKETRGGGIMPLRWIVCIEGCNSKNQIRRYSRKVNAGDWHEKYKVGDYVDFSENKSD